MMRVREFLRLLEPFLELRSVRSSRLLPMEGLRGFAVLLVFLTHYNTLFGFLLAKAPVHARISSVLGAIGHAGVDVFFILSGYLIYAAALRPDLNYGAFIWRRAVRIYPVFLTVLSIYLGLALFDAQAAGKLPATGKLLYVLQNVALLPGVFRITPIMTVAWSLSYEWFFYLTAPALAIALRMANWKSRHRVFLILGLGLAFMVLCFVGGRKDPRFVMFGVGMLLFELLHHGRPDRILTRAGEWAVAIAAVAGLCAAGVLLESVPAVPRVWSKRTVILCLTMFPLVLYSFRYDGFLNRVFSFRPLRYWGNISYSYYLCHSLAIHAAQRLLSGIQASEAVFWLLLPIVCLLSIGSSLLVYLLIERPFSLAPAHASYKEPLKSNAGALLNTAVAD